VPENLLGPWVVGAANGMGRSDLAAATAFVERFRGEPWYETARTAAYQAGAATQPLEVARAIERDPGLSRLASAVVSAWAANDAPAAARWLTGTVGIDDAARRNAVGNLAGRWAAGDTRAATRWVLDMPAGPTRDAGLSGLINAASAGQTIDTQLLEAYSSADARERGVVAAMPVLGRSNPTLARTLIEAHVRDPQLRRQAEQMLESAPRPRGNVSGASGSLLTR
jgi:hypothetical protein